MTTDFGNVALEIRAAARRHGDCIAMRHKVEGQWRDTSYREVADRIDEVARALLALDVAVGERVLIFGPNSPDWILADLGAQSLRAVPVPVFATSSAEQVRYIVEETQTRVAFAGAGATLETLRGVREACGLPEIIITLDGSAPDAAAPDCDMDAFRTRGRDADDGGEVERRASEATGRDLSTIIYTSGTTGEPKGVMLAHENFRNQFTTLDARFDLGSEDRSLCFLPLSHVYERSWSYYVYLKGASSAFVPNPMRVIDYMRQTRPTAMVSAPRLYEKIHAGVMEKIASSPAPLRMISNWALGMGHRYQTRRLDGGVPWPLKLGHALADRLVLRKIRAIMGGPKNFLSSGGAALAAEIEEFFFSLGFLVCQGYGLTETAPMLTCNAPGAFRFGSVGRPVDGVELKFGEDGEILARGPNVMRGYYRKPELTAEVLQDGWFRTGDTGDIDADGFLSITGRLKDLIVTSTGKNVAPQLIETVVGKDPYIEQLAVIGDRRKHISALVVPAYEALAEWARGKRLQFADHEELVRQPEVVRFMTERIRAQSKSLAPFERIRRFTLMARSFSMEAGEMTPTLKIRRDVILRKYHELIERMYGGPAPGR